MVNFKKISFPLNHVEVIDSYSAGIPVGQLISTNAIELELFNKSLALAGDLKRLPFLRSIYGSVKVDPTMQAAMVASGLNVISVKFTLYNGKVDVDNIFGEFCGHVHYSTVTNWYAIYMNDIEWGLVGGLLLNNKLNVVVTIQANSNVAGITFPGFMFTSKVFFEIDWAEISKSELTEYITEHVYADMGE